MKKLICIALALSLTGCATGQGFGKRYEPIVDMKGEDIGRYNANLRECQQLTGRVNVGGNVVGFAIAGAVLGAALGVPFGLGNNFVGEMAGFGALAGGAAAGDASFRKQERVIMRCLQGRGYRVLG